MKTQATKKSGTKKSVRQLKKILDATFSLFIRQRDKGICFTCGVQKPTKEMQCGHYISRSYTNLRFDERNCHAQCVGCNVFKYGNLTVYALKLIEQHGVVILEELERAKRIERRFTTRELENMIQEYKSLIS